MRYENSRAFAQSMDREDPLKGFREKFYIPEVNGKPSIYLCGNSLGLQPKSTQEYLNTELESWKNLAVEGHFHGKNPWFTYHKLFKKGLAHIAGAKESEVVAMNNLTTNLHLMMVSFYRPQGKRFKIMTEGKAFPSDHYALETQVKFHGYKPEQAIIELHPRQGEQTLRAEDILKAIEENADELALVMLGGLQYYTGQVFDMAAITEAGHKAGALVGFDLAHAAGNIPLSLHDWQVDFAVWCSYKYMNSGPGSVGGAFVHEKHADNPELPRFAGWWGHDEEERFLMEKGFKPMYGVDGWQLSNGNILPMAAHKAALDMFLEAGMPALREKSIKLTGFLEFLLNELNQEQQIVEIITPKDPQARGCQLSLFTLQSGRQLFEKISQAGVIADWREPNVIRIAPTPMYNTFEEVYDFVEILRKSQQELIAGGSGSQATMA
jgi:kynureninase